MQGKAERRLRESRVGPSVVVVVSTGKLVEMVELVDDFAGVWTIVIGLFFSQGTCRINSCWIAWV